MGECVLMNKLNQKILKETLADFKKDAIYIKLDHPHEILDYLKEYDIKEISEHWYDSEPPECQTCDIHAMEREYGKYPCGNCPYWKHWSQTENCLTKLTWIDICEPEDDGYTQKEVNEIYDHMVVDLLESIDLVGRVYIVSLSKSTDILIYIYARDEKSCDYGFVLEKK